MKKVVITVGGYGYRPDPEGAVQLITSADGPIEVADEEAERIIGLGIAKAYEEEVKETTEEAEEAPEEEEAPDSLEDCSVKELREKAKELGIAGCSKMSKEKLIEEITATEEAGTDDEEPPVLEAAEPEA